MKNSFLTYCCLLVTVFVISCRDTNVVGPQSEVVKINAPIIRDGYLIFSSYKDFLSLLKASKTEQENTIAGWPVLEKFTSLEQENARTFERNSKDLAKGDSKALSSKDEKQLFVSIPILNKIVNKLGIVVVDNKLFSFSMENVKVLTKFSGSQQEINHLLEATKSIENEGLYVSKVEVFNIKSNSKEAGARVYNGFELSGDANPIPIFYPDEGSTTGFGFTYGHVRGYVNGVRTNYPVDFCPGPGGTTFVCGWDYSFSVNAHGDFYFDEIGTTNSQVNSGVSIVWSTDRGSGSGNQSVIICNSGSGMYGIYGETPFSDIEGTVTFSLTGTIAGSSNTSTVTVSL
jgi:hypothetical protein